MVTSHLHLIYLLLHLWTQLTNEHSYRHLFQYLRRISPLPFHPCLLFLLPPASPYLHSHTFPSLLGSTLSPAHSFTLSFTLPLLLLYLLSIPCSVLSIFSFTLFTIQLKISSIRLVQAATESLYITLFSVTVCVRQSRIVPLSYRLYLPLSLYEQRCLCSQAVSEPFPRYHSFFVNTLSLPYHFPLQKGCGQAMTWTLLQNFFMIRYSYTQPPNHLIYPFYIHRCPVLRTMLML